MEMEKTLVLLKPDAVNRGLLGRIVARLEDKGLTLCAAKYLQVTPEMAAMHYAEHQSKAFYGPLVRYITSAPIMAMVWEGRSAVTVVRLLTGATDGIKAAPGTIRGDYSVSARFNLVHASDSTAAADREMSLFFKPDEILAHQRLDRDYHVSGLV